MGEYSVEKDILNKLKMNSREEVVSFLIRLAKNNL